MTIAEELVTSGGPSAPVWAFLTTITLAIIADIYQTVKARWEARHARVEAEQANANTTNVSNGFASGVGRKLDRIIDSQRTLNEKQDNLSKAFRDHLEWHLNKESQK